jgi:8-oxo-dGTP pyrophosphatase MutT (NUDIX family)
MSYEGSYVWKVRQKVGDMKLLTATVDILPVNDDGKVKIIFAKKKNCWNIVGGHVEEGDSWQSAAVNELREEAGIVAEKKNLVPFAAISGAGTVGQFSDGSTQAFTMVFLVREWENEKEAEDTEEISEVKWVSIDEALTMKIMSRLKLILLAYREYLKTGEFQMIEGVTEKVIISGDEEGKL